MYYILCVYNWFHILCIIHVITHIKYIHILLYYYHSVAFELKHNVCGRRVYADGTVDALKFVHRLRSDPAFAAKVTANRAGQRLFNMIDVIENDY